MEEIDIKKQAKIFLSEYEITDNDELLENMFPLPVIIKDQMNDLLYLAQEGEKSSLIKFNHLIEKYPDIPILKSILSVFYFTLGNIKKSEEISHLIVSKHPDYLFGRTDLAMKYIQDEMLDEIPKILGKELNLKALYPDRKLFHINEVLSFLKPTALYLAEKDDFIQAQLHIEIMDKLAPDSLDLIDTKNKVLEIWLRKADEQVPEIEIKKTVSGNKKRMPKFINSEIKWLYKKGLNIEHEKIEKIIALPRETLIKDLKTVLKDSKERYDYFTNRVTDTEKDDDIFAFIIHSFFIIAEIKATELLDDILNILSEDEDFINFYLDDILVDNLWEIIYKIAENDLDKLKQFMLKSGVYTFSKSAVSDAVEQIALHQPKRNKEVLQWFTDVLNFYNEANIKDNIVDTALIGLVVNACIELRYTKLLPVIKKLDDKEYITIEMCDNWETMKSDIHTPKETDIKIELNSIYEQYNEILEEVFIDEDDDTEFLKSILGSEYDNLDNEELDELYDEFYNDDFEDVFIDEPEDEIDYEIKPVKTKIGRNDPCPCGSGKKYKKCCMNKI